jgi:protein TonB
MFEQTLLESSPRRLPVLRRIHYLTSTLFGALVFGAGLQVLPAVLMVSAPRAVFAMAALAGTAALLEGLMLCYVSADLRRQGLPAWPWASTTMILSLPGFLIYLVYAAAKSGDWKRAAIPLAYVAESLLVGILVLVPLIYTQSLPGQWSNICNLHIVPPAGRPPAPMGTSRPRPTHTVALNPLEAPPSIPVGVRPIVDPIEQPQPVVEAGRWVIGGLPGGGPQEGPGILGGLPDGTALPPPPPVSHADPKPTMVRRESTIMAAQGVYQPKPVYPPLAVQARIQGTVMLEAIIGKDGRVQNLKVLSGHPLLIHSALDAVKAWRYQPTLLNGEPVDVQTEINVIFTLAQ